MLEAITTPATHVWAFSRVPPKSEIPLNPVVEEDYHFMHMCSSNIVIQWLLRGLLCMAKYGILPQLEKKIFLK